MPKLTYQVMAIGTEYLAPYTRSPGSSPYTRDVVSLEANSISYHVGGLQFTYDGDEDENEGVAKVELHAL